MRYIFRFTFVVLISVFTLAAILVGSVALVYKYQEKIVQTVLQEANQLQAGHFTISGSHIEFLKTFPYISIDLKDVRFYADHDTTQAPIYAIEDLYVGFDILELLEGNIVVKRIQFNKGKIKLVRYPDGEWNIARAKAQKNEQVASDTVQSALAFKLKSFEIRDVTFEKIDSVNFQYFLVQVNQLHTSFKMLNDSVACKLESNLLAEKITLSDTPLFVNKPFALHLGLGYHLTDQKLYIAPSAFEIGEAAFNLEGTVDVDNQLDMDLRMAGRKPDFSLAMAFLPNETYQALKRYKKEGQVSFGGRIRGKAAEGHTPQITLEFEVENGNFLRTDRNRHLQEFNLRAFFSNGEGRSLETSRLWVEKLQGRPGEGQFRGHFEIRNFLDPYFQVTLFADIDLTEISEFLDLEAFPQVSGKLLLDMKIDEFIDMDNSAEALKKTKDAIASKIEMRNLNFKVEGYPHVFENMNGVVQWNGGDLFFRNFRGKVNQSDLALNGKITNLSSLIHRKPAPVTVALSARSNKLDLPDLLSFDPLLAENYGYQIEGLQLDMHFDTRVEHLYHFKGLPKGEFFIDSLHMDLAQYAHPIRNIHMDLLVGEQDLTLKDFCGQLGPSDFLLTATVKNYPALFDSSDLNQKVVLYADFTSKLMDFEGLFHLKGQENPLPVEYRDEKLKDFVLKCRAETKNKYLLQPGKLPYLKLYLEKLDGNFTGHRMAMRNFYADLDLVDGDLLVRNLKGRIGKSDFQLQGRLENLQKEQPLKGFIRYKANILDLDELMAYNEQEEAMKKEMYGTAYHDSTENIMAMNLPDLQFDVEIGKLTYHKYHLDKFQARGKTTNDQHIYFDTLAAYAAGGSFGLTGYLNSTHPDSIYFKTNLKIKGMSLERISYKMDNFGTDYTLNENLNGVLDANIDAFVRLHADFTPYLNGCQATIDARVTDGSLRNFAPLEAMARFFGENQVRNIRFGELSNTFDFRNNKLIIPRMEISSTLGFIHLSGEQSMDMQMDYFVQVPLRIVTRALRNSVFGAREPEIQEVESSDGRRRSFLNVRVSGTPDNYRVELRRQRPQRQT